MMISDDALGHMNSLFTECGCAEGVKAVTRDVSCCCPSAVTHVVQDAGETVCPSAADDRRITDSVGLWPSRAKEHHQTDNVTGHLP